MPWLNTFNEAGVRWLVGWTGEHEAVLALARFATLELPVGLLVAVGTTCVVGDPAWRRTAWQGLGAMALAWLGTRALQAGWPSPRPFAAGVVPALLPHPASPSFPSSHAALAFALAALVWWRGVAGRPLGALLWLAAGLIAWSRVALGLHFPLDVLAGALLGTACGGLCASWRWCGRWLAFG